MVTDEMVSRALVVIMAEPGLSYFDTPEALAGNREIIRRAIAAAIGPDAGQSEEEQIRALTRAGMENPVPPKAPGWFPGSAAVTRGQGRTATIGADGNVTLREPMGDL
jgi:hypothetical protein